MYVRTNVGLRTIVKILETFKEVLGDKLGKTPCYNTVENWVKKLGLSVYEDDQISLASKKIAGVIDESIFINDQKLLTLLGIPAEHQNRPVKHEDVTVLSMKVGNSFTSEDIKNELEKAQERFGMKLEYVVNDQGRNLLAGVKLAGLLQHIDISHAMGTLMKNAFGKSADFLNLTEILGEVRLKYHLTKKAYMLPPNMRSIARFMNLSSWVEWGISMLRCFESLPADIKEAFLFVPENKELLEELSVCIDAVKYVETTCKNEGFSIDTCCSCKNYIIQHVIGNASPRRAMLGIRMLEYFDKEFLLLEDDKNRNDNISSDIIESTFGIFKSKKSPNKLYGITPFALIIPLYPKLSNESITKKFNLKERLVNVKLKDIDSWATENMSTNWVSTRIKTLKKVG